jgi:sentrin-specific protease 1
MSQHGFSRLAPGEWLDDEVIDYLCKEIILPETPGVHFYTSHFMTTLLQVHAERPGYCYEGVRRWSRPIEGGLENLKRLIVPINKGNYHWLLGVADLEARRIELYDSNGCAADNVAYMRALLRYIYDDTHRVVGPDLIDFGTWSRLWRCQDMSTHSPRQENGYDCGVFTVLSAALISKDVPMTGEVYTQALVSHANIRDRFANIILDSIPQETALMASWLQSSAHPSGAPTPLTGGRRKPAKRARTTKAAGPKDGGGRVTTTRRQARRRKRVKSGETKTTIVDLFERKRTPESRSIPHPTCQTELHLPPPRKRKKQEH